MVHLRLSFIITIHQVSSGQSKSFYHVCSHIIYLSLISTWSRYYIFFKYHMWTQVQASGQRCVTHMCIRTTMRRELSGAQGSLGDCSRTTHSRATGLLCWTSWLWGNIQAENYQSAACGLPRWAGHLGGSHRAACDMQACFSPAGGRALQCPQAAVLSHVRGLPRPVGTELPLLC